MTDMPNTDWEKRFEESMYRFIVQPTGGDKCPHCGVSGTPTRESTAGGTFTRHFSPALAYLNTETLQSFISEELSRARQEVLREAGEIVETQCAEAMVAVHGGGNGRRVLAMVSESIRKLFCAKAKEEKQAN